jgi:large subunit ribosomal protein L18
MSRDHEKWERLARRKLRSRRHVAGDAERPRLSVYRSLKHIYAQVIDDSTGRTLASASSVALKINGGNIEGAKLVGKAVAERAQAVSVKQVRFDRAGRRYHGRIKALADAAREGGLQF